MRLKERQRDAIKSDHAPWVLLLLLSIIVGLSLLTVTPWGALALLGTIPTAALITRETRRRDAARAVVQQEIDAMTQEALIANARLRERQEALAGIYQGVTGDPPSRPALASCLPTPCRHPESYPCEHPAIPTSRRHPVALRRRVQDPRLVREDSQQPVPGILHPLRGRQDDGTTGRRLANKEDEKVVNFAPVV